MDYEFVENKVCGYVMVQRLGCGGLAKLNLCKIRWVNVPEQISVEWLESVNSDELKMITDKVQQMEKERKEQLAKQQQQVATVVPEFKYNVGDELELAFKMANSCFWGGKENIKIEERRRGVGTQDGWYTIAGEPSYKLKNNTGWYGMGGRWIAERLIAGSFNLVKKEQPKKEVPTPKVETKSKSASISNLKVGDRVRRKNSFHPDLHGTVMNTGVHQ